jgi:hypothetical protein
MGALRVVQLWFLSDFLSFLSDVSHDLDQGFTELWRWRWNPSITVFMVSFVLILTTSIRLHLLRQAITLTK